MPTSLQAWLASVTEKPTPNTCYLCGQPSVVLGMCFPEDSQAVGAPAGKQRILIYALCENCFEQSGSTEAVEKAFKYELACEKKWTT